MLLAGAVSLAGFVVAALVDALLKLPQRGLLVLFGVWAGLSLAALAAVIVRQGRARRSLAATARRVELAFPEAESHLINLVQFSQDGDAGADPFRAAAIAQSAAAVAAIPLETAAARETRRRRFLLGMQTPRDLLEAALVLGGVLGLALACLALVPAWGSATRRILHPLAFVPSVGSVRIAEVTPGDAEVLLGSSLEIAARVENPAGRRLAATLFVREPGKPEAALAMLPDEHGGRYVAALAQVLAPLEYRLEVGDSQTTLFRVGVYEKPTVAGVEAAYTFPEYLGRPPETVRQDHGDLEVPQYTRASLTVRPSTPIARGHLTIDGRTIEGRVEDEGRTLHAELSLDAATSYTIHLETPGGHTDPQPRLNRIAVVPDAPPTVQLVEPAGEATVAVGARATVVVRAGDDHGLGEVRIERRTEAPGNPDGPRVTTLAESKNITAAASVLSHPLELSPGESAAGQTVWVRGVARDRRRLDRPGLALGPQESATPWLAIRLVAPEAKAKEELARLEGLRNALARILQDQLRARVEALALGKLLAMTDPGPPSARVRTQQAAIQRATAAVADSIAPAGGAEADAEAVTVKRVAGKLAGDEMVRAIRQAEALERVSATTALAKPVAELAETQARIIDVLRRLLGEIRHEEADLRAEMKKRPGTELPSDVKDKLKDLKDRLAEFLKQQKKVIEATEDLAKKPVEDFTEKDKQLLKELAATEDDWARFMADRHSDLSKLPEQDFANPSLLKELIEVQTELKMAKDALTKKTADIAVPLEQLGAEMAKEMTTNIEKWLPDTPDREKWSQEEPLADDMKEAPMAELPRELEDIVGKLMEGEEDLFDEMEDASSSWADSLDKGAGWDAMDGPISNNSARGVTGNRMPNSSEIAGRSGEGRQGKSSGEFVGDTAVGKGGRKTPSRLTPDAYVKGQIKDLSKDPVGGATGGGKESGQGGEGLHGPTPDRPARELARLAGKQAQLRNQAEGVNLKFQVLKYHHTDLKRMIELMAAVEDDLKAGRYRSALRRRDVLLEGLGQVKTYARGEFTVRRDQTANLPAEIQKEILGSMQEPSPPGWEDLNRHYFERLTTAPSPAPTPARQP